MAKDDSGGLLSKVVKFVRNPGTNWSDLDHSELAPDSGHSKQMLKDLVERKKRNDFVRKREFEMLRRIRAEHGAEKSLAEFKQGLREQYYMLRIDESRAIELIPKLLQGHEDQGPQLLEFIRQIVYADGSVSEEGQRRLARVERLFTQQLPA